jgi:tetratricopeptide (TPR) repeat protein
MKQVNLILLKVVFFIFIGSVYCSCKPESEKSDNKATSSELVNVDEDLSVLDEQLHQQPNNAPLLHKRALIYIQKKRYQDALTDMNKAVSIDSTRSEYYLTLADLAFAANRTFNTREFLEKALTLDPDNQEAMLRLAELYLILQQHRQSVELLSKVLAKDKSNTTAWLMRGLNFKETGDTNRAVSDFRSAIEANADFYDAYMQLGMIFQLRNDPVSLGYFNNAIRIRPQSEEALYGRGLWYQDHDQLDKAIQDYTTIVQINPGYKNAHFNLGYIHHIYLKVYPEAIKHYSRAIEADNQYAEAFYNRGLCYEFMGNLEAAAADFRSALMIKSVYPPAEEGLRRVGAR